MGRNTDRRKIYHTSSDDENMPSLGFEGKTSDRVYDIESYYMLFI